MDETTTRQSPLAHERSTHPAPPRPRIAGLDFARFLALTGMMAAHVWATGPDGSPGPLEPLVAGKASALFALLAGVGIVLTTRADLAASRVGAARWNVFGRGAALILLGLTLGLSPSGIVVILVYYGVMFWVAIPLLRWSSTALLVTAGALAVAWPFASSWLRAGLEQPFELGSANWLSFAEPVSFARGLFLTGVYPVPTWIVYALVGMVVGRLVIAAADATALRRLGARLVGVGVVLAAAGWGASALLAGPFGGLAEIDRDLGMGDPELVRTLFFGSGMGAAPAGSLWWLASPGPHTGTTVDLAITTGTALAVVGACLALATLLGGSARRLLEPIRRAGAAPLTVYAVHVIAAGVGALIAFATADLESGSLPWYVSSGPLWALHVAGAVLIGAILLALDRRGPLETLVSWSGRILARRAQR
ncbi:heparan-alpha-glucosaminide N-acetyltransferase domain-containing protein [Microbacterium sp. gxy059]|uniref:heparan-alpha-glucosaminide N-acetyltransferase domain-containing protein n=1 Tax=Microbacterium sp. gxy059 TaxID=2957199 RepID=UPI003D969AC2